MGDGGASPLLSKPGMFRLTPECSVAVVQGGWFPEGPAQRPLL